MCSDFSLPITSVKVNSSISRSKIEWNNSLVFRVKWYVVTILIRVISTTQKGLVPSHYLSKRGILNFMEINSVVSLYIHTFMSKLIYDITSLPWYDLIFNTTQFIISPSLFTSLHLHHSLSFSLHFIFLFFSLYFSAQFFINHIYTTLVWTGV